MHLVMTPDRALKYENVHTGLPYRPSIDLFFKSVASHWPAKSIGILLTGMGKDGAEGLKALKEKGWYTIAEHQDSCVVYGMPKAAVEIGAAVDVLPLNQIAPTVMRCINSSI